MLNPLNSVLLLLNTCWISTATFWSHLLDKKSVRSPAAREELVYHEAFAIVKGFLKSSGPCLGTIQTSS